MTAHAGGIKVRDRVKKLESELAQAEVQVRRASRRLAGAQAKAALAVAEGGEIPDFVKEERSLVSTKSRAQILRSALELLQSEARRERERATAERQTQAHDRVRTLAQELAEQLDAVLSAGLGIRLEAGRATKVGAALPMGAVVASPELESSLAAWRDRLLAI